MKILHINTHTFGGAATACIRIHLALLAQGVDSKMLVLHKTKDLPEIYQFDYFNNRENKFYTFIKRIKYKLYYRKIRKRNSKLPTTSVYFSFPQSIYDITQHPLYKEADIIQLNWTSGFLDEPSFFRKNKKPVIWRMADLYTCGGGNHYEKFFSYEDYGFFVKKNYQIRKKSLKSTQLFMVPISQWTRTKAEKSNLLKKYPMKVIHNGLDLENFKPYKKEFAREFWGLPSDKTILLFGADNINNPSKGLHLLIEALSKIDDKTLFLCVFGNGKMAQEFFTIGNITDNRLLRLIYSAADFFILPSQEETFGQVTIEAMACGIPVVSFPTGGSLDIIKNGVNGILAEDFTSNSLKEAITLALNTKFNRDAIIDDVKKRFNIIDKAKEYIDIYKDILATNRTS